MLDGTIRNCKLLSFARGENDWKILLKILLIGNSSYRGFIAPTSNSETSKSAFKSLAVEPETELISSIILRASSSLTFVFSAAIYICIAFNG